MSHISQKGLGPKNENNIAVSKRACSEPNNVFCFSYGYFCSWLYLSFALVLAVPKSSPSPGRLLSLVAFLRRPSPAHSRIPCLPRLYRVCNCGLATIKVVMIRSRRHCPCRCCPPQHETHHSVPYGWPVPFRPMSPFFQLGERFPLELAGGLLLVRSIDNLHPTDYLAWWNSGLH
jgi:hypothetical protein